MAQNQKYTLYSLIMGYFTTPVKTCISLFLKLTVRYHGLVHVFHNDPEKEIMLGYESSWAGVYDSTDKR